MAVVQIQPPPSNQMFPNMEELLGVRGDYVGTGADLSPGTLLAAYARGMFPMPTSESGDGMDWWCPERRGVLPLAKLRVSRSMRASAKRYEIRVDTAFEQVVVRCGTVRDEGNWIDDAILAAYCELHRLGWAHSVETWLEGRLVGGLYGVALGGLFAGESMFHLERDASKVALMGLVDRLNDGHPDRLLDVQWWTPHLGSLGVIEVTRADYLARLTRALDLPPPPLG